MHAQQTMVMECLMHKHAFSMRLLMRYLARIVSTLMCLPEPSMRVQHVATSSAQ